MMLKSTYRNSLASRHQKPVNSSASFSPGGVPQDMPRPPPPVRGRSYWKDLFGHSRRRWSSLKAGKDEESRRKERSVGGVKNVGPKVRRGKEVSCLGLTLTTIGSLNWSSHPTTFCLTLLQLKKYIFAFGQIRVLAESEKFDL